MSDRLLVAPRYAARFRCIAEACEDDCCAEWDAVVDRRHYDLLREALGGSRAGREEFAAAHERVPPDKASPSRFAVLRHRPDGNCLMLDPDRRCSIHRRWGEGLLSDTCANYPRSVAQIHGRTEVTLAMSCPEAARLCLLDPAAPALVPLEATALPRPHPGITVERARDDSWTFFFDDVRGAILELLGRPDFPLGTRLFVVAWFGDRVRPFFHRGAASLDERRLAEEVARLGQRDVIAQWHEQLGRVVAPTEIASRILLQCLAARGASYRTFRRVAARALEALGAQSDGERFSVSPAALHAAWRARSRVMEERYGARLDGALANYCAAYWLREPYTLSPDLLVHTHKLLLRLLLIRLLLAGQPPCDPDAPVDGEAFDRALVEVVAGSSRAIDHSRTFLAGVQGWLADNGLQTLAHAALMLKL